MISFIVPVFYKNKNSYIVQRAKAIIDFFEKYKELELIIADASKWHLLNSKFPNIQILNVNYNKGEFSPAIVRNLAVEKATKKYLFFLDVDLSFSELFLDTLKSEINQQLVENRKKFLMLPCLYLSPKGTKIYEHSKNKIEIINEFRESLLLGENKFVERLAINTSAIVLEKEYFIKIGKFSEDFFGHGGEDFEFIHRLMSLSPYFVRNEEEYYYDKVEQFPINYKGFRKYMAYYSFEYIFSDLVLVHKWHERALMNFFYMKRNRNENLLIKKMKAYDSKHRKSAWKATNRPINYQQFLKNLLQQHGYTADRYIGLYKYGDSVKIQRPMSAKIRKLITRPIQFFLDIKWIKKLLSWKNSIKEEVKKN